MTTHLGRMQLVADLVPAVLDRAATFAKAEPPATNEAEMAKYRTPNRPEWWDNMNLDMRKLADAAIEARIWEIPQ